MTAEYNAINGRAELYGDGSGWQRMRGQFPTAPAGTKQAIYVMRIESPDTAGVDESGLTWNAACYYGLKFDSTFPSSSERDHADYDNFFGIANADDSPYDHAVIDFSAAADLFFPGDTGGSDPDTYFYDGAGSSVDLTSGGLNSGNYGLFGAADGGQPNVQTLIWRIYSDPVDNSVYYECWRSDGAADLTAFDIATDLDPDNPKALFPVGGSGNYIRSGTIQGDVFGTTPWRPNDGAMAFPQYFMAAHPSTTFQIRIPYVGVHYSLSVT